MIKSKLITIYVKESPLGLKYLGQTVKDPYKYKGSGVYWKKHIKKHKVEEKIITTILFQSFDREEIKQKANYYSQFYNIVKDKNWANLIPETGENKRVDTHPNEETRLKIGRSSKGRIVTKETRDKISKSSKGKIMSKESKDKISKSNKGKKRTKEFSKKMSLLKKGFNHSRETKLKISKFHKGKITSEETKLKISLKNLGKKMPIEALKIMKEKLSYPVLKLNNEIIIKEFNSIKETSILEKISRTTLSRWIKNKKILKNGDFYKLKN